MSAWRHRIRVWFEAEGYHDIMSQTSGGATRTATVVRRMLGYKGPAVRPSGKVEDLGHLGTDAAYCPVCSRKPSLFPAEEKTNGVRGDKAEGQGVHAVPACCGEVHAVPEQG